MVIAGFEGTDLNEDIMELIEEYSRLALYTFRNTFDEVQTLELLNDIKEINLKNPPLLLSIDEEGGKLAGCLSPILGYLS